jgi:hypothetical protein
VNREFNRLSPTLDSCSQVLWEPFVDFLEELLLDLVDRHNFIKDNIIEPIPTSLLLRLLWLHLHLLVVVLEMVVVRNIARVEGVVIQILLHLTIRIVERVHVRLLNGQDDGEVVRLRKDCVDPEVVELMEIKKRFGIFLRLQIEIA